MLGAWRVLRRCKRLGSAPAPLSQWLVYPASGLPSLLGPSASLNSKAGSDARAGSAAAAAAAAGTQRRRSKGSSSGGQPGGKAGAQEAVPTSESHQPESLEQQQQQQQQQGRGQPHGLGASNGGGAAGQASPVRDGWREQYVWVPWEERLKELAKFVADNNRLPRATGSQSVPLLPKEKQLGAWCQRQRQRWKGKMQPPLKAGEVATLEAIPGWFWEQIQRWPWAEQLRRLTTFVRQHRRLPRSDATPSAPFLPEEQELGSWCRHQRQRRKGNRQPRLSPAEAASLAAFPGWYWDQQVEPWQRHCQAVAEFERVNGRLPRLRGSRRVPLLPDERELAKWCDHQRQRRKGNKQPPLSAEQEASLEAIPGWPWEQQVPWERQCQAVAEFVRVNGRLPRSKGCSSPLLPGEGELGRWRHRQQQRRKGNVGTRLSAKQEAALEAIPGL